jgi:hypothetical protein
MFKTVKINRCILGCVEVVMRFFQPISNWLGTLSFSRYFFFFFDEVDICLLEALLKRPKSDIYRIIAMNRWVHVSSIGSWHMIHEFTCGRPRLIRFCWVRILFWLASPKKLYAELTEKLMPICFPAPWNTFIRHVWRCEICLPAWTVLLRKKETEDSSHVLHSPWNDITESDQLESWSWYKTHNHLSSREMFCVSIPLMPRPPCFFGKQTCFQFTRQNLPAHLKLLLVRSVS